MHVHVRACKRIRTRKVSNGIDSVVWIVQMHARTLTHRTCTLAYMAAKRAHTGEAGAADVDPNTRAKRGNHFLPPRDSTHIHTTPSHMLANTHNCERKDK